MEFKVIDLGYESPERPLILVVDDESALQTLIFDTLDEEYRLVAAHNGREGVDRAGRLKPALILMDVLMPDIGGYDAIRLLGANEETRKIPVIVMTAQDFDDSTIQMIRGEPNVAGFLTKPFRPQALREAIRAVLEKNKKT